MCIEKMIDEMSDACYTMDNNQHCEVHMKNKQPPFQITNKMIADVAEISELTGRLSAHDHLSSNPNLRRTNRIRTIHGSLAIEQNTLSLEQVTAHGIMTRGLVDESGIFRTRPVGVVDQEGHVLHFGTLPQYVPDLVMELLDWAKHSDLHMLIRSCVFHYELELIHPFADGNGRIGRLWHTLLLSKLNPVFAWLPVESIIHDHQQEYYDASNASNDAGESTAFIEFMLSVIKASLMDAIHTSDAMSAGKTDKKALRWQKIEQFLQTHEYIMNADVRELCGVSAATANRILANFASDGKLMKSRVGGHWGYKLLEQ